jgi:hypothetical protein
MNSPDLASLGENGQAILTPQTMSPNVTKAQDVVARFAHEPTWLSPHAAPQTSHVMFFSFHFDQILSL